MMRFLLILAIAIGYTAFHFNDGNPGNAFTSSSVTGQQNVNNAGEQAIRKAFENHSSNLQVEGSGKVIKILQDDTRAPRHQRFILNLDNGITLLVAHNIDLAKRINDLKVGDAVSFKGEYEWNKKGGVLHWTHLDPQGSHAAGWLRHNGQTYQ